MLQIQNVHAQLFGAMTHVLIAQLSNYSLIKDKDMRRGKMDFFNVNAITKELTAKGIKMTSLTSMHIISGC